MKSTKPEASICLAEARSALMDSIRDLALEQHFSRATLKTAETLASSDPDWLGPLAWYRPEGSEAHALQCEVREPPAGSRCVTVYLFTQFGEAGIESACTCARPSCAHAAALLIRVRRWVEWPRVMTPLERWQQRLGTLAGSAPAAPATQHFESPHGVCLIRPAGGRDPGALLASLILVPPGASLDERDRWLALEQVPPETMLPPQLLLWQARLARGPRSSLAKLPGHELQGAEGAALLAEWLEADICHHAETLQRIRPGVLRTPHWEWSLDSQAQAHLRLHLSEDGSVPAVALGGLHYLDESRGEFGGLALPAQTWSIIEQMPPIPPGETSLRNAWPPHPLLSGIPAPPSPPKLREIRAPLEPILVIGAARRVAREEYVFYVCAWADYGGCRVPLAQDPWREAVIRRASGEFVTVHRQVGNELTARRVRARNSHSGPPRQSDIIFKINTLHMVSSLRASCPLRSRRLWCTCDGNLS